MSDRKVKTFGVYVTEQDAVAFLATFGPSKTCEVCNTDNWLLTMSAPGETAEVLTIRTSTEEGVMGTKHVPIFINCCQTCGYTRTHSTHQMAMWVKARDEARSK